MQRSRLLVASLLALLLGLVLCQSGPAWAVDFTAHPIRPIFSPKTRSTILRLRHQSREVLRFQLNSFA